MKLTKKQLQTQNAILLAVHGTDDIEEARNKDLWLWCVLLDPAEQDMVYTHTSDHHYNWLYDWSPWWIHKEAWHVIIWLPPTLERVLHALNYWEAQRWWWGRRYWFSYDMIVDDIDGSISSICNRELMQSLRDQSKETQDAIHELLCKNRV